MLCPSWLLTSLTCWESSGQMAFKAFLIKTAFCCVTVCSSVPCGRGLWPARFSHVCPFISSAQSLISNHQSIPAHSHTCSWFSHHLSQHPYCCCRCLLVVLHTFACVPANLLLQFPPVSLSYLPASSWCLPVSLNFTPKALKLFGSILSVQLQQLWHLWLKPNTVRVNRDSKAAAAGLTV